MGATTTRSTPRSRARSQIARPPSWPRSDALGRPREWIPREGTGMDTQTEITTTPAIEPAMREQFVRTVEDLMARDERVALLLAEISVSLFKRALRDFPERVVNVGIMEQTLVSVAAGFALEGFIPVAHSIAPFLVERPFEQIKDDFCYQNVPGNCVSNGASYDYR